ncbi:hypothetical protein DFH08DRAFT_437553 [Mycena albidolilacea]|uniref:Uncharacterized protein n=1 Tax=Mycena albidolilacea TaxID=1033008 RepID=A0AAD7EXN7_9AGAR|nr:hypothetical protein DFH08DRAFT_437553 [Mycena albidolilacea]
MRGRSLVMQRRGTAPRSSPLGRFPAVTPTTMAISSAAVLPSLRHKLLPDLEPDIPASTEPSSSRNTIGLGRLSTSKRCAPLESDDVGRRSRSPAAEATPHQLLHHQASHRTLPRPDATHHLRILRHHPAASPRGPQTLVRTGSTARAANIPAHILSNDRRAAPATPTAFTPSFSRCARKHPGGTSVSSIPVLAPRSTSSGAPQAGPGQVRSLRVLFPATMAGAPNFQSLDGAVSNITTATRQERGRLELEAEFEETDDFERGGMDGLVYGEDGSIKFKVHTRLRIRFAARRLKTLF